MVELLSPQRGWRAWTRGIVSAGLLLLASCGGGGDPGGGGGPQAGVGSGGTGGGTGSYSNGSVSAFGSIVVNGVHYDHTSAVSITKVGDTQGTTHVAADMKLGMMVEVDVTSVVDGKKLSIRYGSDLLGAVDSVDLAGQTLTVMGHVVSIFDEGADKRTRFGDELQEWDHLADLNLQAGDVVEVYGYEDPSTGTYIATRIERKAANYSGAYVVRGVVENLSADKRSCDIGRQHIAYVSSGNLDTDALANGLVARVEVTPVPSAGSWYAIGMTLNKPLAQADRGDAAISGLVTKVDDPLTTRFSVNGVPVDASLMGTCPACVATPSLGAALSIKGALVNGVIMATEVKPLLP